MRNRAFLKQMLIVVVAVAATAVAIQVRPTAESAPAPLVAGVQVDADAQLLTIQGVNFGDQLSQATLALSPLAVSAWTSTSITAGLPPFAPGTYLLVLQRTDGAFSNSFHLTIGAVGPIGPAGPQGDPGAVSRATDTLLGFGAGAGALGAGAGDAGGEDAVTRGFEDDFNTAYGFEALHNFNRGAANQATHTAVFNAAFGRRALRDLTEGSANLAIGVGAMRGAITASDNTAIGNRALGENATGTGNIAIGSNALVSNVGGSGNIAIGALAGNANAAGSNNVYIGNLGDASDSGAIRIGTTGTHTATYLSGMVHGDGSGLTGVTAVYQ